MNQRMRKYLVFIVGSTLMICLWVPNLMAGACDADVDKYCGDVQPGQGQLDNCINQQRANFSSQCRDWLKNMDSVLKRIGTACSESARAYCRDVRPGYGRVEACLRSNMDKLPKQCQEALGAK